MEQIDVQRCCKKTGDRYKCAKIATHEVWVQSKNTRKGHLTYRCDKHKTSGTCNKKVSDTRPLDQSGKKHSCLQFLLSQIGQRIYSRQHGRFLTVKFVKPDLLTVMCQEDRGNWRMLYPNQIK